MPYIAEERRRAITGGEQPKTAGELTYALTDQIDRFINRSEVRFDALCDAMGALEATKHEFYRRVVTPYEEDRMRENGDLFRSDSPT